MSLPMAAYVLASLLMPSISLAQTTADRGGQVGQEQVQKIFLIGNSLTWDTLPGLLEGDVQWHVDCGKSLKFIHEHPSNPCVKTSTLWPAALKEKQYDYLVVQPHFGTTLDEDAAVISDWLRLQPNAILVIHTGWNRAADFEAAYRSQLGGGGQQPMTHAPAYFAALTSTLRQEFPQTEIRSTHAIEALNLIWHDIAKSHGPFDAFPELYRDSIHMTTQVGRYLMHNLMRQALGQPPSVQGFQIEPDEKAYLDTKLGAVQELSSKQP